MTLPLPTRKAEDWRYADLTATAKQWPLPAAERIAVPAGEAFTRNIIADGGITRLSVELAPDAKAAIHILSAGTAEYSRVELDVTLHASANFTLGGVQIGGDAQNREIVTRIHHEGTGAISRQTVRSVLAGHAIGSFLGQIAVARGANGTDAAQSVRAMLLSPTATANARPELEIFADDVKCAHGCAVGQLDAAALFYLQSRGLDPAAARRLMLQAFIAEAFAGADDQAHLMNLALAALERAA